MKISIILIPTLLLITFNSFSQAERLYNINRALLADTSYSISVNAYQILRKYGANPLRILQKRLIYPEIAKGNYIRGSVIASFEVTKKSELINIKIEESTDEYFSKSVLAAINDSKIPLVYYLKPQKSTEKFYIPFKFDLEVYDFKDDVYTHAALTKKEIIIPSVYTPPKGFKK